MWKKAFENFEGLLKQAMSLQIFQRLSSTNFTWSILEYLIPYNVRDGIHYLPGKLIFNFFTTSKSLCSVTSLLQKFRLFLKDFVSKPVEVSFYRNGSPVLSLRNRQKEARCCSPRHYLKFWYSSYRCWKDERLNQER